jgi:cytidyltransferase-like protein
MHSGHFNALRQCKMLCETLVCGVVGDQEMIAAKGPNIMGIEERCELARACKWVDEVNLFFIQTEFYR